VWVPFLDLDVLFICQSFLSVYLSSVYLSICLPVYLSLWLCISMPVRLFVDMSLYLSVYLFLCLSASMSTCLSVPICLSVYLFLCLPFSSLSVSLLVNLYICLSISRSICPGNKSKHRSIYLWIPLILLIVQPRGESIMGRNFGLDIILIIPAVVSSVEPQDSSSK
jgi:hypothetical protein